MCYCTPTIRTPCCGAVNCVPKPRNPLLALKEEMHKRHQEAEKAAYAYFKECEVGPERTRAAQIYENIRTAVRVPEGD